ncbi:MAG TPA: ABC transporter ATP-binding protein [Myxococcales bacterium]|jgi:ABC-2 type transport system ATP-binding protein|nr:ABC transporter ATP-binding protein [Myxococcales bacterium]
MTEPTEPATLQVEGLGKIYGEVRAVTGLSFDVRAGEIVGLVGPNGAGKTSTLRCLSGIIPPNEGQIRVAGRSLGDDPVAVKRDLAFIPDEPRLFEYLTAREHLAFIARLYEVEGWEGKAAALWEELELKGKEDALPSELSRGMKQKLTIACAFLRDPRVILLDEPLTGLDPFGIRKVKQSLRARARAGAALLLSSHLLPIVEELCDRVLVIAGGKRVAFGTIADIRAQLSAAQGGGAGSLEDLFMAITAQAQEPRGPEP